MQLKIKYSKDKSQYISQDWLYDTIVSLSPRLVSPLSYDIRK